MALINTIHGLMSEDSLVRTFGEHENDNEIARWIEYRPLNAAPDSPAIHRSVHVHLKRPMVFAEGAASSFG